MDEKKTSASSTSAATDTEQKNNNNNNNTSNNNNKETVGGGGRQNVAVTVQTTSSGPAAENSSGNWLCCVPCYWLRRNNSVHKASLTIATLLVTSLLVASPVLFLISAVPASDTPPRDCSFLPSSDDCLDSSAHGTVAISSILGPECSEPQCLSAAARITSPIHRRADPCSDFAKYSCGRWKPDSGAHSLGDIQNAVYSHIQQLLSNTTSGQYKKLGEFYRSCIRMGDRPVSMSPMYNLLDRLGGYLPPGVLGPVDLTTLIARLLLQDGAPLLDIRLIRDPTSMKRSAVLIDAPVEPRPDHPSLNDLLGGFLPQGMSSTEKTKEIQLISGFVSTLEKIHPKDITTTVVGNPTPYNISRLQILYPLVKWCTLFEQVLGWNCTDNNGDEDTAYVTSSTYLTGLNSMIGRFPNRIVHNSVLMLYARDRLHSLLNYTSHDQGSYCTKLTSNLFQKSVGNLYVKQYPLPYIQRLQKRTTELFDKLKSTLTTRMKASLWLDNESQESALEKLERINTTFFTTTNNNNLLDEVDVDADDFFGTVVKRYGQLRRGAAVDKPIVFPHLVRAHYDPTENNILIPLALLVQPYFRDDLPACLEYATVGQLLGHELLHGFDLHGVGYDSNGRPGELLNPAARLGLVARVDCLARQQPNNQQPQEDWNEVMIDIGALQTSYQTWRNGPAAAGRLAGLGMAPGQLFHVVVAQTFCSVPNFDDDTHWESQRINGMMMNSPSFSEAFDCPVGSPMNPIKKCSTW